MIFYRFTQSGQHYIAFGTKRQAGGFMLPIYKVIGNPQRLQATQLPGWPGAQFKWFDPPANNIDGPHERTRAQVEAKYGPLPKRPEVPGMDLLNQD